MKALLSVSDKTGLIDFARGLREHGIDLIASGGTARMLKGAGLSVTTVEALTGTPEILDGRVKTLHPRIHAGILARDTASDRDDLRKIDADFIDLVVVNLYPFQQTVAQKYVTLADAIENIDIGGVALIRAAAKNYNRTAVICDPGDYDLVLRDLTAGKGVSLETREVLAFKAFAHTAEYDGAIRDYLLSVNSRGDDAPLQALALHKIQDLRYGENPHQRATLYGFGTRTGGPLGGKLLQGKELSYNNLLDLDAAWRAATQFAEAAAVIVKHLSPCAIATAPSPSAAFSAAFACDPVSAFGGVLAFNRTVDAATVKALGELFVECIAAPGYDDEALGMLSKRKNCRVLDMTHAPAPAEYEYRSVANGMLRQTTDAGDPIGTEFRVVSKAEPTSAQVRALRFAMQCAQHVKSNAIVIAREAGAGVLATVGIGGGQPNRVDSVRIAAQRAGERAKGAVMASDAFFPFPDGVLEGIKAGVTAIIHPGGSVRDEESVAAADHHGVPMVTTGVRHFRH